MNTPVYDFLLNYRNGGTVRFHMPGHKGVPFLGCEPFDLTEIKGADSLYEADSILAESERNVTMLFGSGRTCYATQGSSQCIQAMLYLAITNCTPGTRPVVIAARNVHKTFVFAAGLLDFEVVWLWPEQQQSLCGCPVSPEQLDRVLKQLDAPPAAVYVTSPDYLGGMADIAALAEVAHRHGTILAVDNAHGAYLRFLKPSVHPLDLGADLCCDSAHKTLPVLTGGAYLHIGRRLPGTYAAQAKSALALFGSTSPSYLTMASLDLCNRYLSEQAPRKLENQISMIRDVKNVLLQNDWKVEESDPLRITICAPVGKTGTDQAELLRNAGIECEFADESHLVLMLTPENTPEELERFLTAMGKNTAPCRNHITLPEIRGEQVVSIRQALFSGHELVPVEAALGRICAAPTVSCPPAVPIAISGERITAEMVELFQHYQIRHIDVLK